MAKNIIPVVLSGGMGTRLWPLSRASFPKQFCELLDESLLEKTLKRLSPLGSPWTLTVSELKTLTSRVYRELGLPLQQILFEPLGRNTAPAIGLLCHILQMQGKENEVVGIFPADHLVLKTEEFIRAMRLAQGVAEAGHVVTLGLTPQYPATGFGYIETTSQVISKEEGGNLQALTVKGFQEKPDQKTAERFVASGNFYWNAGIFIFKVRSMMTHFELLMPELWNKIGTVKRDLSNLKEVYSQLPSISIDYGIMEKLNDQICVPCEIGWSDLGSWDDVARYGEPPFSVPFTNGAEVISTNSSNNFIFSLGKKVCGLVNVEDLIVVETDDALLIAKKGHSQDVRKIVDQLNAKSNAVTRDHRFEHRPWGSFTVLRDEPHYKSKFMTIDPGEAISYQSHEKRSEHWIIVRGSGEVILDNTVQKISGGDSVVIPQGIKHRIRNTGKVPIEFIEVQTGSYFGEDDIVRYEDDYQRV